MGQYVPFVGRTHTSNTWTQDFQSWIGDFFNEPVTPLDWSGRNNANDRRTEAQLLPWHTENPNSPIRLVGYSHGGNVAIEVANLLGAAGLFIDHVITIGTPVRKDFQINRSGGVNVGQHINVYNFGDMVQNHGGRIWHGGAAARTFDWATNVRVAQQRRGPWGIFNRPLYNHSFMHSSVDIWERYIVPMVRIPW